MGQRVFVFGAVFLGSAVEATEALAVVLLVLLPAQLVFFARAEARRRARAC